MSKLVKKCSKYVNYENLNCITSFKERILLDAFYLTAIPISSFVTICMTTIVGYYINNSFVFILLFFNLLFHGSFIYFQKDFIKLDRKYNVFYNDLLSTFYFLYFMLNSIICTYLPIIPSIDRHYCFYAFLIVFAVGIIIFMPRVIIPLFIYDPKKFKNYRSNGDNNL